MNKTTDLQAPDITKAEQRAIEFELRAVALNGSVVRMSELIRTERQALKHHEAWLASFRMDPTFYRQAITAGSSQEKLRQYGARERVRVEGVIAQCKLKIALAQKEYGRLQAEWDPLQRIADGMRAELDKEAAKARQQLINEPKEPREPSPEEVAATRRYERDGVLTDDISRPLANAPAGATLDTLQTSAYEGRNRG